MSRIPIPRGGLEAGRAVRAQPVPDGGAIGQAAARLGNAVTGIALDLEADRTQRELARFRIDATKRLAENRFEYEREADPDVIATGFKPSVTAIRDEMLAGVSDRARENATLTFDALSTPHALAVGQREIALRGATRLALANEQKRGLISGAAKAGDQETETALLTVYADTLQDLVARGDITQADRIGQVSGAQQEIQSAVAIEMLANDPDVLLSMIDGPRFEALDAGPRARLRARATSAVKARAAKAEREADRQAAEASVITGRRLSEISAIAGEGRVSADEEFLTSPEAQAHPDFAKAQAAVSLRTDLPGFTALPPAEMREQIEAEQAKPIGQRFQNDRLQAMRTAHQAASKAWADDPIAQASRVFAVLDEARLPQPMPALDGADDDEIAGWLVERSAYGQSLTKAGYTETEAFFSKAERAEFAAATGANQPPERRARIANLIAQVMPGERGVRAMREIGGDAVTVHAGSLLATGGSPETAMAIFEGQDALAAGNVTLAPSVDRNAIVVQLLTAGGFVDATTPEMIGGIRQAADAIYAAGALGANPSDEPNEFAKAYEVALNAALGGASGRGGVQDIAIGDTGQLLLPPSVAAEEFEAAFEAARMAVSDIRLEGTWPNSKEVAIEPDFEIWRKASQGGGIPEFNNAPITPDRLEDVTLNVRGNDLYSMQINRRGVFYDVTDSETGDAYLFRLTDLIKGAGE